ncbi:MAG: SurA N-terminal domain-containing protein [Lachnospiraceae bacterium]|nr:SurA N-terminal domain-containing protein [Lachnospiraceae bacterium]
MKTITRKIAMLLAVILTVGSTVGCGSSTIGDYSTTVVATYGDEKIYLDEANFWLRYQQWMNEAYYWDLYTYFGYDNMWTAEYDENTTMGDYFKENVMAQILQTRILLDHAEDYDIELTDDQKTTVSDHVSEFLESYPLFANQTDATEEQMVEWMEMNAKANLVAQAVKDAAEISISDEECQEYSIEYILVEEEEEEEETTAEETTAEETSAEAEEETTAGDGSDGSETYAEQTYAEQTATEAEEETAEETTEEETAEDDSASAVAGEELAQQVYELAEAGTDFSEIEESLGVTSSTASYLVTGEESTEITYTTSAEMEAGEVQMVQEEGTGWYIIKKTNDLDEDATEEKREELTEEAEDEAFNEVYAEWAEDAPTFKVKEKIWSQIEITDKIYEEETTEEETTDETAEETSEGENAAEETSLDESELSAEQTSAEDTSEASSEQTTAAE